MAEDLKRTVIEVLKSSGKPLKSAEIAEKTGIDSKKIGSLIKELKLDGKIVSPKNCYYSPAE